MGCDDLALMQETVSKAAALGIDIGGTKTLCVLMDKHQETQVLAPPVPKAFVDRLRREGVHQLSVGMSLWRRSKAIRGWWRKRSESWTRTANHPEQGALMVLRRRGQGERAAGGAGPDWRLRLARSWGWEMRKMILAFLRLCGCRPAGG